LEGLEQAVCRLECRSHFLSVPLIGGNAFGLGNEGLGLAFGEPGIPQGTLHLANGGDVVNVDGLHVGDARRAVGWEGDQGHFPQVYIGAVSYTHLTLPTIRLVLIAVVAGFINTKEKIILQCDTILYTK